MQQHLHFICPTDHLEQIINNSSEDCHYYYTSLGNSVDFDRPTLRQIELLIRKHRIRHISFVLSLNNRIIQDALGQQYFYHVRGLKDFYKDIIDQKKQSETFWPPEYQYSLLSYHINNKIKELQHKLRNLSVGPIKMNGQIYDPDHYSFKTIYSDLVCMKTYVLN